MWEVGRSAHRRIAAWGSHLLAHQVPWLELPDLCWMLGCWMVVDGGLMWLSLLINSDDYWCVCVFCSFWECLVARLRVFGHVSRKCIGLAGFGMVWQKSDAVTLHSCTTHMQGNCFTMFRALNWLLTYSMKPLQGRGTEAGRAACRWRKATWEEGGQLAPWHGSRMMATDSR